MPVDENTLDVTEQLEVKIGGTLSLEFPTGALERVNITEDEIRDLLLMGERKIEISSKRLPAIFEDPLSYDREDPVPFE